MRIIPKKTKVTMEFFKGVDVWDALVGISCMLVISSIFLSNLPGNLYIAAFFGILSIVLLMRMDDERNYMFIIRIVRYLSRVKRFGGQDAKATVAAITPFKGVASCFIEYEGYYGVVLEIPSIEFRFLSESKQNHIIESVVGGVLRTVSGNQTASLVKLDRPVIYDQNIRNEHDKIAGLEQAFVNGLLTEEELTCRVQLIYDRILNIEDYNYDDQVIKSYYYLIFYDADKQSLASQARNACEQFASAEIDAKVLGEKQLCMFLKYNYNNDFDEREVYKLSPEQYMEWILPKQIEFTGRTVRYDDVVTHQLRVIDYPITVGNAWGYQLFNIPGTKVVMQLKPADRFTAVRRIDRAIDELRGQQNETAKTSKLIDIGSHLQTLGHLLQMLQNDNEVLFDVNIYLTVFDPDLTQRALLYRENPKQELPPLPKLGVKKRVRRLLSENSFKSSDLLLQQFEAYASSQISARDMFSRNSRGIHSTSVAAVFPCVYRTLDDSGGFNFGKSGGVPVFIDFFKRDRERVNSNMVIIGKSGSGKSFATKTILTHLAAENSKIFILDPENEYSVMAQNLSGKIVDVGSATHGRLNPFHIITNLSDQEGDSPELEDGQNGISFTTHLQFLEEFFRQILPGIDNDALEYLNTIIIGIYEAKGITAETDISALKPRDFPTFDDLYDSILVSFQSTKGDYIKSNLRVLLNYISKFATGGRNANLWNGEATLSTNENFIVFNFQSLLANKNNVIANAQMLLVLKWIDNEIIKNREYNLKYKAERKIVVVIDEAHVFIDEKYPIALDFMFQLAKRIRKYNGMQIIITQNIKDFVGTEDIARKSTAIINACQYSFIFSLAPNDMHDLCKLYEKAGNINEVEQEEIINSPRGSAFVVTSPSSRTSIDVIAPPDIARVFSD